MGSRGNRRLASPGTRRSSADAGFPATVGVVVGGWALLGDFRRTTETAGISQTELARSVSRTRNSPEHRRVSPPQGLPKTKALVPTAASLRRRERPDAAAS